MWNYKQPTGELLNSAGQHIATGYSGAPGAVNDPAKQSIHKVGPIPVGRYTIGEPFDSPDHGPYAMHLTPGPANQMYGRDGFLCHGDKIGAPGTASEGCIIMPRTVRELMWTSGDHDLEVVA